MHKKAHDYDIGIYFEANGHGTAITKPGVQTGNEKLDKFLKIFNPAVGDGYTNILAIETALREMNMTI